MPSHPARPALRDWLRRERGELIATLAWLAVGVTVLVMAMPLGTFTRFGPGPGLFPRVTGAALLILVAVRAATLLRSLLRGPAAEAAPAAQPEAGEDETETAPLSRPALRFVLLAAVMFGYAALLRPLGFVIATTALGWAVIVLLGRRPLRTLVGTLAAILVLRYAFTSLLGVQLPLSSIGFLRALGL